MVVNPFTCKPTPAPDDADVILKTILYCLKAVNVLVVNVDCA